MNSLLTEMGENLRATRDLRTQLLGVLTDTDLSFMLPGNPTLGERLREDAETERLYADAYKSFGLVFQYGFSDPALATDLARLKAWCAQLDADLDAALAALSEDDVQPRTIDRGWGVPPRVQLHCYREARLIFYGRAVFYLRALGKPVSQQAQLWIG